MREYKRSATLLEKLTEVRNLFFLKIHYNCEPHTISSQYFHFYSKLAYFYLQKKPKDLDAFRLLGEVKYELKDYEGSVLAYRNAERVSV